MLSSKTLPGSSLRARSLTAPPNPTLPPIPAARDLARRLDPPPFPLPPSLSPSLPFPSPSHPSALYLSTYPPLPTPLPIYLSTYLPIYLSIYLSTYLPTPLPIYLPPSRLPPSPCPPPGPPPGRCTNSRFPYPSQGLFSSLSSPQALPEPSRDFILFFSFFMLIRRDSNPSPLCLPVNYQFNAYANCAIPARLQIQWFFCMLFICKSNSCP